MFNHFYFKTKPSPFTLSVNYMLLVSHDNVLSSLQCVDCCLYTLRLQMSVHRLLQRGFARLYQYKLSATGTGGTDADENSLVEFSQTALNCESGRELHFRMKGARP